MFYSPCAILKIWNKGASIFIQGAHHGLPGELTAKTAAKTMRMSSRRCKSEITVYTQGLAQLCQASQ